MEAVRTPRLVKICGFFSPLLVGTGRAGCPGIGVPAVGKGCPFVLDQGYKMVMQSILHLCLVAYQSEEVQTVS